METSLLPITVIVAITIFLVKEGLEQWRKHQGVQNQVLAIKLMLADEIEKNNYTLSTLRRTLNINKPPIKSEKIVKFWIKCLKTFSR